MERPPKKYVCEKCGYLGDTSEHEGCDYLAWTTGEQIYIDRLELAALRASPASAPEDMKLSEPTILPDGRGFGILSLPLPKDLWLYAEREYEEGAIEPKDLPAPILTHALHQQVIAAIRYAVRASTNCGKEEDFDPDAMVQNAVYALCGHYGSAAPTPPVSEGRKDAELLDYIQNHGATIQIVPMANRTFGFEVGGLHKSRKLSVREAIDAAMQEDKP